MDARPLGETPRLSKGGEIAIGVVLPPDLGGTAQKCILFKGWPSEKENTMRLPVLEGFLTFAG